MIAACDATLAAANNDTIIIPGRQTGKQQRKLRELRDMLASS